jgi:hypothetical protein
MSKFNQTSLNDKNKSTPTSNNNIYGLSSEQEDTIASFSGIAGVDPETAMLLLQVHNLSLEILKYQIGTWMEP